MRNKTGFPKWSKKSVFFAIYIYKRNITPTCCNLAYFGHKHNILKCLGSTEYDTKAYTVLNEMKRGRPQKSRVKNRFVAKYKTKFYEVAVI